MTMQELERLLKDSDPKVRYAILSIHERQNQIDEQNKLAAEIMMTLAQSLEQLTGSILNVEERINAKRARDAEVEAVPSFDTKGEA